MRLLINISSIGPKPTGMGVYASQQARFLRHAFDCDIVAAEGADAFGHAMLRAPVAHSLGAGGGAALKRWIWSRQQPRFAGRLQYSPTHHTLQKADAKVITVHDLICLRFPRQHPLQYLYFRRVLPRELKRAASVFTVSETSKHDIHEHYGYPLERIRVVPNGVDPRVFRPDAHRTRSPFLLTVGAACAHKNVHEILQRGHLWRDRYQLVVASARGPYREELERIVRRERLQSKVRFISYATPAELLELYQSCTAMVTASKWEGFGIPLLEAIACGARVIASDIPAHREVLAGHERLVRLGDEASWADAFTWLERVAPVARNARALGPVERYSWERSGRLLVSHLLEVEPSLAHSLKMKWTHTMGSVA